jgi:hypothetical protein
VSVQSGWASCPDAEAARSRKRPNQVPPIDEGRRRRRMIDDEMSKPSQPRANHFLARRGRSETLDVPRGRRYGITFRNWTMDIQPNAGAGWRNITGISPSFLNGRAGFLGASRVNSTPTFARYHGRHVQIRGLGHTIDKERYATEARPARGPPRRNTSCWRAKKVPVIVIISGVGQRRQGRTLACSSRWMGCAPHPDPRPSRRASADGLQAPAFYRFWRHLPQERPGSSSRPGTPAGH